MKIWVQRLLCTLCGAIVATVLPLLDTAATKHKCKASAESLQAFELCTKGPSMCAAEPDDFIRARRNLMYLMKSCKP